MKTFKQSMGVGDAIVPELVLKVQPLAGKVGDFEPFLSAENIDIHYNDLTKGYLKKAQNDEPNGDQFNFNGLALHNIMWSTMKPPVFGKNNVPEGEILDLILRNHKSFSEFQQRWKEEALALQGSGWLVLLQNGRTITIRNHALVCDDSEVVMLLDLWEHAYFPTYGPNKEEYIKSMWFLYDWTEINKRVIKG